MAARPLPVLTMTDLARRLAADTYQRTLESIAPNAARLKRASNSHLGRALLIAVNLHLLLVGVYWVTTYATATTTPEPTTTIDVLPPIVFVDPPIEAPDAPAAGGGAAATSADTGTPTPAPDETVSDDTTPTPNDALPTETSSPEALPGGGGVGPVGAAMGAGNGAGEGRAPTGTRRVEVPRPGSPTSPPPKVDPVETPADGVFEFVEVNPELIGDIEALQSGIEYPAFERSIGVSGQVVVQFVVDEDGRTSQVEVVRSVSPGLDRASVDAVRRARFTPGEQNGRVVRVRMTLPVTFRLR